MGLLFFHFSEKWAPGKNIYDFSLRGDCEMISPFLEQATLKLCTHYSEYPILLIFENAL